MKRLAALFLLGLVGIIISRGQVDTTHLNSKLERKILDLLKKSNSFLEKDQIDSVDFYFSQADQLLPQNLNPNVSLRDAFRSLGDSLFTKKYYHSSLGPLIRASQFFEAQATSNWEDNAVCYATICNSFYSVGDYKEVIDYSKKALFLVGEKSKGYKLFFLNVLGMGYLESGDFESAHLKFVEILQNSPPSSDISTTCNNIGLNYIYEYKRNFNNKYLLDSAKNNFNRCLRELKKGNTLLQAKVLSNLGLVYQYLGDFDSALAYNKLVIGLESPNIDEPKAIAANNNAYIFLHELHNLDSAMYFYQQAAQIQFGNTYIRSLSVIDSLQINKNLLAIVKGLATTYYARFQINGNVFDLDSALHMHKMAMHIISEMRNTFKNDKSKVILAELATPIYENAISVCYDLYKLRNEKIYLEEAFKFDQAHKAVTLFEILKDHEAKVFSNIPEELIEKERELKSRLFIVSNNSGAYFEAKEKLNQLLKELESSYPNYFQLKYSLEFENLETIQQNLLNRKTSLISYFLGDSTLFIQVVNHDKVWLEKYPWGKDDTKEVKEFLKIIHGANEGDYITLAHRLNQKLIEPISGQIAGKKLIIIPDGLLNHLPFDALITKLPDEGTYEYNSFDYLIKSHAISYAQSPTVLLQQQKVASNRAKKSFLGMAPVFDANFKAYYQQQLSALTNPIQDEIFFKQKKLSNSFQTIQTVASETKGDALLYKDANEGQFKSLAQDYRLLHLSTHGEVNDQNPLFSWLLFGKNIEGDSVIEDGFLNTYEIYQLPLKADLVILSACKTGLGEIQRGEGVISVARAFHYAGCPSVMMSLWNIEDEKSEKLISIFFDNLKAGMSKDDALHRAKLTYLKEAKGLQTKPFYWASMVLNGNTHPVSLWKPIYTRWWFIGIIAILVLLLWVLFQRKVITNAR